MNLFGTQQNYFLLNEFKKEVWENWWIVLNVIELNDSIRAGLPYSLLSWSLQLENGLAHWGDGGSSLCRLEDEALLPRSCQILQFWTHCVLVHWRKRYVRQQFVTIEFFKRGGASSAKTHFLIIWLSNLCSILINSIKQGRQMLGETQPLASKPGSIRGDYSIDLGRNICHGSDSPEAAEHELKMWFPEGVNVSLWWFAAKSLNATHFIYDFSFRLPLQSILIRTGPRPSTLGSTSKHASHSIRATRRTAVVHRRMEWKRFLEYCQPRVVLGDYKMMTIIQRVTGWYL